MTFQENGHVYKNTAGQRYISVTTLIGKYVPEFNADYWAQYKAIKDVFENMGMWRKFKGAAGGWEHVVKHYNKYAHTLDLVLRRQVNERKQEYLDMWKLEGDKACKIGTRHHKQLESDMLNSRRVSLANGQADISAGDLLSIQQFDRGTNGVYTELLLWNDRYRIAGQADLVERYNKDVHIKDYKTFKRVEFEAFMDKKLKPPLNELPNTNYAKATMQLSTYGWMLEQAGFNVIGLTMIHLDRNDGSLIEEYPLAYRKDLVIKMLNDYESN